MCIRDRADAAGLKRFHVLGHDWGGGAGWALAEAHPERLLSLTSLSTPHPRAMAASMVRSNQALKSWYMLAFQLPWLPEAIIESNAGGERVRGALIDAGMAPAEADDSICLLYTSDAADDLLCVDLGGRRLIKKKNNNTTT